MKKLLHRITPWILILCMIFSTACISLEETSSTTSSYAVPSYASPEDAPAFSDLAYVVICENQPDFSDDEITNESFESYSDMDELQRCGIAFACIGQDIMPTEERGKIGQIKPSGWQTVKYDFVDGKYLYNRCHLIGFQLAGENANEKNLITGTRYMNTEGMLPFENKVADYVKNTDNHVMYRVTPIFENNNLVARGVQMEAYSVEDQGDGVCFNVFCYNAQPGVEIDYATGDSWEEGNAPSQTKISSEITYVINTNNHKFHKPDCSAVKEMKVSNRKNTDKARDELIAEGYTPCGKCKP